MRNQDLQKKTEDVQNEFDMLMNEMNSRRNAGMGITNLSNDTGIVDDFYAPGSDKKHKSPTRRLIKHKNSTWEHKKRI
jgi:hypothetical protein